MPRTVAKPSIVLSIAALFVLWLVDWHVSKVNFGPLAALPIFFLVPRLPRGVAYAVTAVCAAAFALADADLGLRSPDLMKVSVSALALFAAFSMVAWSSRRFLSYRQSVDDLRHALIRREELADVDFVSGTYNRMYFERTLLAKLSVPGTSPFAIVFSDIDGFKDINDRSGHLTGDAILREVAERFAASIGSRGIVARIGGDEFAAIVERVGSRAEVATVEGELRATLEAPFVFGKEKLAVTASLGSSVYPDDGDSRATLLAIADARMYAAKRAHRAGPLSGTIS